MGNKRRGLFGKFIVERVDGSDRREGIRGGPPGKHYGCEYFVLDLNHDPHAKPALIAYALSAEEDGYALLAADLRAKAAQMLAPPPPSPQRGEE